ncbi:DNA cytosine methyltransferase [Xanthomonas oryzae pv. oryzae]|uniref:DNA cytosine methyltransferase n=1 Tax=Xanthomonas oryzae TaxID=347 RepID=UPI000D1AC1A0|nr:DNA cytosine methyltransferase [Xanthomonas oryzae]AVU02483.1 DNA (cytosine-5-)-methyltransferase [Xanthomonas oryzae pv. oryzae]QBI15682.1 DNA cytosine methyltransferase [Xanthomonas oryzae pv. oryzae]QBN38973.1 DNA cytosine methyltransferase [Xanthomonas oryzae pv. oryzae]QBN42648.1 DNA cytosine methyltransferase [Xanthomonas oryzae pv. oryzae]QBN46299.1 DNA cytosine methyltransferase [Xanthomonas oryzae pv. oryzae]
MRYLSLFSGMEAAHLAWSPLGWRCGGVAEIDPAACALLRHRLPHVPNLGSVTDITDEQICALGQLDVVIGGSPCQDLSVAGKRAGLAGARSGLFHQQLRIFNAARHLCGARWLVWENVPGAFSSNKGRDFAVVAGALAGCELTVPADGWGNEGVAVGDNGLVEWSVLDAQWFGVAQRRRRVFAVLDTGDWASRPPVLLERDSLRGDSAPSRETGAGAPVGALVGTSPGGGWRIGPDEAAAGHLIAFGGNKTSGPIDVGTCLNACASASGRLDFESETFLVQEVAHTLRAEGFDASEDGTGRGTPLIPVTAFGCKDSDPARSVSDDVSPTLRAMGHAASHANAGGQVAIAFQSSQSGVRIDQVHATLDANNGPRRHNGALVGMQVRRLTPRECERLQGAEDDWTLVPNATGKPMADGPRYKMLGNSFAVPVIRWIGQRIESAHGGARQERAA